MTTFIVVVVSLIVIVYLVSRLEKASFEKQDLEYKVASLEQRLGWTKTHAKDNTEYLDFWKEQASFWADRCAWWRDSVRSDLCMYMQLVASLKGEIRDLEEKADHLQGELWTAKNEAYDREKQNRKLARRNDKLRFNNMVLGEELRGYRVLELNSVFAVPEYDPFEDWYSMPEKSWTRDGSDGAGHDSIQQKAKKRERRNARLAKQRQRRLCILHIGDPSED